MRKAKFHPQRRARIFGLAGSPGNLQNWVGANFGRDLNGVAVTNLNSFQSAVNTLRSPLGRNPSSASSFSNPPKWAAFDAYQTSTSAGQPDGNSLLSEVQALQAAGIEPLLVFWLSCTTFQFSTLDQTTTTYWGEHWELYKHQFMGARWAYLRGVRKLEFWCAPGRLRA